MAKVNIFPDKNTANIFLHSTYSTHYFNKPLELLEPDIYNFYPANVINNDIVTITGRGFDYITDDAISVLWGNKTMTVLKKSSNELKVRVNHSNQFKKSEPLKIYNRNREYILNDSLKADGAWQLLTNYPGPIGDISVCEVHGDKLYVGMGSTTPYFNDKCQIWEYNFDSDKWSKYIEAPFVIKDNLGSVFIDDNWYLIGGASQGEVDNNLVWSLNFATKEWKQYNTLPFNKSSGGYKMCLHNSEILIAQEKKIWKFFPDEELELIFESPKNIDYIFSINNELYFIDDKINKVNIQNQSHDVITDFSLSKISTAISFNNFIYIYLTHSNLLKFNFAKKDYDLMLSLQKIRYNLNSFVYKNRLYFAFGKYNDFSDEIWEYNPEFDLE